jgi:CheY-like chemotaxis protein
MRRDGRAPILVAEDNQVNVLVLRAMLRRHGYEALVAGDGVEAIAMAARHAPGLILMDLHMPRLGGFAAAAAIRRSGLPAAIVAVTADAGAEARAACSDAGFDGVLEKPIVLGELIATVRRHLATEAKGAA